MQTVCKLSCLLSRDVPFLHETENNRNIINGLFVVNGTANAEQLKSTLMERVISNTEEPSYARMRKRVTRRYGRFVWEDEVNFDINKHVALFDGPTPCSEKELQETLSELISKPIPEDISPWLTIVLPLNLGKEQFGVVMRVHHAIGDGFSMVGLISQLVDKKPELLRVQKPVSTPCDKQKQVGNTYHLRVKVCGVPGPPLRALALRRIVPVCRILAAFCVALMCIAFVVFISCPFSFCLVMCRCGKRC